MKRGDQTSLHFLQKRNIDISKSVESRRDFKHGIASYPTEWRGYVVSPEKICIQFNDVNCKTRIQDRDYSQLTLTTKGTWNMPIDNTGTDIKFLAVGIPITLYPTLLDNILLAIKEHSLRYPSKSLENYMLKYAQTIKEMFHG